MVKPVVFDIIIYTLNLIEVETEHQQTLARDRFLFQLSIGNTQAPVPSPPPAADVGTPQGLLNPFNSASALEVDTWEMCRPPLPTVAVP